MFLPAFFALSFASSYEIVFFVDVHICRLCTI